MKIFKKVVLVFSILIAITPLSISAEENTLGNYVSSGNDDSVILEQETVNSYEEALSVISSATTSSYNDHMVRSNIFSAIAEFDRMNYDLKENYSEQELIESFNYTPSQADAISTYDGSEISRINSAATRTASLILNNYHYDTGTKKTYLRFSYDGQINGVLVLVTRINLALSIGGSQANYFHGYSTANGTYSLKGQRSKVKSGFSTDVVNGSGVVFSLPYQYYETSPVRGYYTLTSWHADYQGVAGGKVSVSGIEGAWLSNTTGASFGVSFSKSGVGISISPKFGWKINEKLNRTVQI